MRIFLKSIFKHIVLFMNIKISIYSKSEKLIMFTFYDFFALKQILELTIKKVLILI
jgi:hypothetical protein